MSVHFFYLARAAEMDVCAERMDDLDSRRSLQLTADSWRLLAQLADDHGFDDLPALRLRVPSPDTHRPDKYRRR